MSVDIRFEKGFRLKDFDELEDVKLNYYPEGTIYVLERDDEYLQVITDSPTGDKDTDNDKIHFFTSRGHGMGIVKTICEKFKCSFLTDEDEEELIMLQVEMYDKNLKNIGLTIKRE